MAPTSIKLADDRLGEKSEAVQARVKAARSRQRKRFAGTRLTCNAEMTPTEVREFCQVEESAQSLLKAAMKQLYLSARAFHRILKLAGKGNLPSQLYAGRSDESLSLWLLLRPLSAMYLSPQPGFPLSEAYQRTIH